MLQIHDSNICIGEVDVDVVLSSFSFSCLPKLTQGQTLRPRESNWSYLHSWRTQCDWSVHVQCMGTGVKYYSCERNLQEMDLTCTRQKWSKTYNDDGNECYNCETSITLWYPDQSCNTALRAYHFAKSKTPRCDTPQNWKWYPKSGAIQVIRRSACW